MKKPDFLIELQTEDLPANELKKISESFLNIFKNMLIKYKITYNLISLFATPRRLAITINSLKYIQKKQKIRKKGPLVEKSFNKKGLPTSIAISWAKHCNINIQDTKKTIIDKKIYLTHTIKNYSLSLLEILKKIILYVLIRIPIKKSMYWNEKNFRFSRPIRNIIVLLDSDIIPINFFHLSSNRFSHGHFFMKPKKIKIYHANQYTSKFFYPFYVMINYEKRKNFIKKEIKKIAHKLGKITKINNSQLHEVTSLVEWPVILSGKFNIKYLNIPKEILIYIMEKCQKYFPLYSKTTKKISRKFIFVSNIITKNSKNIIHGNENVLTSKLSNVNFFIKKDINIKLYNRLEFLKKICFQKKLGSMFDKTNRIRLLSTYIAIQINLNIQDIDRAALLSKCDLTTYMITEYPELQGIIGMYYAQNDQEKKNVSLSIKEQYLPKTSKDLLPTQNISYALGIAEKLDTITGIFSIKKNPKKNNDPFALRRAAIGIIRVIIEKKIDINIKLTVNKSINLYKNIDNYKIIQKNILKFIFARLIYFYQKKNYNKKIIKSVLSLKIFNLIDINERICSLEKFNQKNKIKKIIEIYKRIENILKKESLNLQIYQKNIKIKNCKYITSTENILIKNIYKIIKNIKKKKNYFTILIEIKNLFKIINKFFQTSFINDPNKKIKKFRISILQNIQNIFLYIANFSYL